MQKVEGNNTFKRGSGWGRSRFIRMDELLREKSTFLLDDTFVVRCTIEYTKSVTTEEKPAVMNETTKILNTDGIHHDSQQHLTINNGAPWHDVTLLVGGNEIYAHRWILSASCPVLAQLVAGQEAVVKVEGVTDPEAFSQMIRFIYTGEVDLVTEGNAYKLLAVASKYRLLPLMTKCESHLLASLDKNNCYITYSWADLTCASHLKSEAAKFIDSLSSQGKSSQPPTTVSSVSTV